MQGGSAAGLRAAGEHLCAVSGNFVLFLKADSGSQVGCLRGSDEPIGCVALGKTTRVLAYSELSPSPNIYVVRPSSQTVVSTGDVLACLKGK